MGHDALLYATIAAFAIACVGLSLALLACARLRAIEEVVDHLLDDMIAQDMAALHAQRPLTWGDLAATDGEDD